MSIARSPPTARILPMDRGMADVRRENGVFEARYVNHFRVGFNEFEFIFDFGQLHGRNGQAVEVGPVQIARIVMAPPFAQALLTTLQRAVDEHEQQHGPIDRGSG